MDTLTLTIFVVIVLLLGFIFLLRDNGPLKHIPGPVSLPLLRHFHLYLWYGSLQDMVVALNKKYGPIFQLDIGLGPTAVVCDPKYYSAIKSSTMRQFKLQHDKQGKLDTFYNLKSDPLFNLDGQAWHERRAFLRPAFAQQHIREMVPIVTTSLYSLFERKWGPKAGAPAFDPRLDLKGILLQTTGRTSFGHEFQDDDPILKNIEVTVKAQIDELLYPSFLIRRSAKLKKEVVAVDKFMTELVEGYTKLDDDELQDRKDLLAGLVRSLKEEETAGTGLDKDQVKDEAFQFVIAGYDTTASTAAWAFLHIGTHPAVQDKIVAELQEKLPQLFVENATPEDLAEITYDALSKKDLPYTAACIQESQRLAPIAPFVDRKLPEDVNLGGYLVPKDCFAYMGLFVSQRSKDVFGENAEEFVPERWLEEESPERKKAMLTAHMPFGGGPRMCIGMQLAEIVVRSILASVLCRWKVSVVDAHKVRPYDSSTIEPKGLKLKLDKREPTRHIPVE